MTRGPATRAVAPLVGTAVFVALAVVLAATVGAATLSLQPHSPAPRVAFSLSVDGETDRIALTHDGGDQLSVDDLRLRVQIDGVPLAHQPPVPFFVARGFRAGPTGPFNVAGEGTWSAGETASVKLASTNDPALRGGTTVRVRLYAGDQAVADLVEQA